LTFETIADEIVRAQALVESSRFAEQFALSA
jgi:hypothetical protein